MTGRIFNIQRFSTQDGPGIRTTVFMKGCPLSCAWCHNPESKRQSTELFYNDSSCIGCGACAEVCSVSAHSIGDGHIFDRTLCTVCGRCAEVCPSRALELCGEDREVASVIDEVMRDAPFYRESGGGLTLSGGEPLMQWEFSLALLREAKARGLHTAVETSGYTDRDIAELAPLVDLWLFDIKHTDEPLHREYVGVGRDRILATLDRLSSLGASIVLRCPVIDGVNLTDAHADALADLASHTRGVIRIDLEPYHPLGVDKADRLGRDQAYACRDFLAREMITDFADRLRSKTAVEVVIA